MRKIILCILLIITTSAIVGLNSIVKNKEELRQVEQLKQETENNEVDEKIDKDDIAVEIVEEEIEEEPNKTENNELKETKSKSTNNPSSSVSDVPKKDNSVKQESKALDSKNNNLQSQNTEQKNQENTNTQSNNTNQNNNVSTAFYDSITGGKKEFPSESACFARGTQIQDRELDYVLDYNEEHPDSSIQPEINYFRCYPVIDEQGEGWYLHFFCRSGEGLDAMLKSKY